TRGARRLNPAAGFPDRKVASCLINKNDRTACGRLVLYIGFALTIPRSIPATSARPLTLALSLETGARKIPLVVAPRQGGTVGKSWLPRPRWRMRGGCLRSLLKGR